MSKKRKIAILGGNEKELSVIRELHGSSTVSIIGIYDRNDSSPGMIIGRVIGLETYSDENFLERFKEADLVITNMARRDLGEEIEMLTESGTRIIDIADTYKLLQSNYIISIPQVKYNAERLDEALSFMNRISDTGKLLEWILQISADSVGASQGSIMLYSESTGELYIGYATGLSEEVIRDTRLKLGEGIAGKSASIRKAILTRDIGDVTRHDMERENIMSAVTAPIIYRDSLLGVLNISTDRGE
ncbi:MAG: GAF domain-containing protein, partial [Candidatus Latescibacteria bacterium]|nr:GAF domain-containing protein [bacterium]MBD3424533.1 GAF domain-containing protein [Candidatus Latescibacterota bacterium]